MRGPDPHYQPDFPAEFVQQAQQFSQKQAIEHRTWQRATMVVILDENPRRSSPEIAQEVGMSTNSVRRWKKRWASGDFSLEDREGRGRKPKFDGL